MNTGFTNNIAVTSKIDAHFYVSIEKKQLKVKDFGSELLSKFDDIIDLHEVMDEYVYSISKMHHLNKNLTQEAITEQKGVFNRLIESTKIKFGVNNLGITVYDKGERLFGLDLVWFDKVVDYLNEKHAHAINHRIINHNTYLRE